MKTSLNIFICLISILISSCETEFSHVYVISNETSYLIKIIGFDKIQTSIQETDSMYYETIEIAPNSKFQVFKQAGYHSQTQGVFEAPEIDSIEILFDKKRRITFSCNKPSGRSCAGKYNLMNIEENYEKTKIGKSSGKDEYSFTYTFTKDDFENASAIE